jgi:hypothetical protein
MVYWRTPIFFYCKRSFAVGRGTDFYKEQTMRGSEVVARIAPGGGPFSRGRVQVGLMRVNPYLGPG